METVIGIEWGYTGVGSDRVVVRKLSHQQESDLIVLFVPDKGTEVYLDCLVEALSLAVRLWVSSC
jgi:hypothetical protein